MTIKNKPISKGTVREFMTSNILSVDHKATLKEVAELMSANKKSVVLVKNDTPEYVGVVTDSDFTRKVAAKNYSVNSTTVDSIMSSPIKKVDGSMQMDVANEIMRQFEIGHLVVLDNGEFKGILSAINLICYYNKVEDYLGDLVVHDGLTGIYNRRYFDEILAREWKRTKRDKTPLSLIMLDIDYFKKYNDTYGHQAGDECLRKVAKTVSDAIRRPADMVARYGGEEFVVILPNMGAAGVVKFSETIRANIEALKIEHKQSDVNPFVTVSLGIACTNPDATLSADALLGASDKALYDAKTKGRNRVSVAKDCLLL